jgi:hypothetical protein
VNVKIFGGEILGAVPDLTNRRLAITVEINALSRQQIQAVRHATFLGWGPEEKAAYDERADRMIALRYELFNLDDMA